MFEMAWVYWNHTVETFTSVIRHIELKAVAGVFVPLYSFFFSIASWKIVLAVLVLILFDLLTGVIASKKKGEKLQSRKMCKTAFKTGIYGVLISASHLVDVAVGGPVAWISFESSMMGFLAATELISILENAGKAGFVVPDWALTQMKVFRRKK